MIRTLTILATLLVLLSSPVLAGKKMNKCVGPEGKITFTTQGCAVNESKRRIYVPNAQSSISGLRPGEVQGLGSVHSGRTIRVSSVQSGKKHLSWSERQALKNSSIGQQSKNKTKRVKRCNKQ